MDHCGGVGEPSVVWALLLTPVQRQYFVACVCGGGCVCVGACECAWVLASVCRSPSGSL